MAREETQGGPEAGEGTEDEGRPEAEEEGQGQGQEEAMEGEGHRGEGPRRKSRRRQERMAQAEAKRRRKAIRTWSIVVLIIALGVVAAVVVYLMIPEPTEKVVVQTSTGSFEVEWSGAENPVVVVETTMGTFEVELFMDQCPQTAGNFLHLVETGFYDGLIFHRVIADFMIQGGDPQGTGSGGPGYSIDDEASALALKHLRGSLSMANSGANTGGSQFFICDEPQTHLDGKHAVFGKVVAGQDVVDEINQVNTDTSDRPLIDVKMTKVHVKG